MLHYYLILFYSFYLVRCEICNGLRDAKKHRRHLRLHLRYGEISKEDVGSILFQTKFTRKDSRKHVSFQKFGRVCSIKTSKLKCGVHVLDLANHIKVVHGFDSQYRSFKNAIKSSVTIGRRILFRDETIIKCNPLFNSHSLPASDVNNVVSTKIQSDGISIPDASNVVSCSTGDGSSTDVDINFDESDFPNYEHLLPKFQNFVVSTSGGSISIKASKIDISNVRSILNRVGQINIWKPHKFNEYITYEKCRDRAPSTIHSKLRSFRRSIGFLENTDQNLLTQPSKLKSFMSMMDGVEKSLLKDRTHQQKFVLERNRKIFYTSIDILKQWRRKRQYLNPSQLFTISMILNQPP